MTIIEREMTGDEAALGLAVPDLAWLIAAGDDGPDDRSPADRPTMPAAEALDRLRRGEPLTDVRIVRPAFEGEFPLPVRLRGVELIRPRFRRATFRDVAAFTHCTLDRPRLDGPVTFESGLDLTGGVFPRGAILRGLRVRGPASFAGLRSRGKFVIAQGRFEDRVCFWEARFAGWVDVQGVTFAAEADFRSLQADEGFVLARCRFLGDFLFRGACVAKKFQADDSEFLGLLDLSKAKLHDFAYLEGIRQGPAQRFALQNALADRILVRTGQLVGRLASEESGDHERAMNEYALLKRNFQALHRDDQEDWAFYRFKVNQRRARRASWRRPWTKIARFCDWLFLDLGCGYGTSPARAVAAACVLILAFAAVYAIGIDGLYVDHVPFEGSPVHGTANRVLIGLQTSVSAFTSGFGDLRDAARGRMAAPLIAESLLGTLLWGLFIVAFSRKVIR